MTGVDSVFRANAKRFASWFPAETWIFLHTLGDFPVKECRQDTFHSIEILLNDPDPTSFFASSVPCLFCKVNIVWGFGCPGRMGTRPMLFSRLDPSERQNTRHFREH